MTTPRSPRPYTPRQLELLDTARRDGRAVVLPYEAFQTNRLVREGLVVRTERAVTTQGAVFHYVETTIVPTPDPEAVDVFRTMCGDQDPAAFAERLVIHLGTPRAHAEALRDAVIAERARA